MTKHGSDCSHLYPIHTCDADASSWVASQVWIELTTRRNATSPNSRDPVYNYMYDVIVLFVLALLTEQLEWETGSRQFTHTVTLDKFCSCSVSKFSSEIRRQSSAIQFTTRRRRRRCELGISRMCLLCSCLVESGLWSQLAGLADSVTVHGWTHHWHSSLRILTRQVQRGL